jgi:uncharacterized protein (DUF2267 family)
MSNSGLAVFDSTLQKTHCWLNELMEELGWEDRQMAYQAWRATLHALRDQLTLDEMAQLGAQFPMLIRGIYYEGWNPSQKPLHQRHQSQFFDRIEEELGLDNRFDPEKVARGVFAVLSKRVSEGEIEDVKHLLPAEIRELWE